MREEFHDSALFRFVVGNVENDDLLRRRDDVVQVHVDRLLLREGSVVVLFVNPDSIIDVNVNGARGLVRFVQHGIVRLYDALRLIQRTNRNVVLAGGPDHGVVPARLVRFRLFVGRGGERALLVHDDRRLRVDVQRLEGSARARQALR